ncbi:hypothetical protein SK128_012690 [Halocaridina rubra]|uniref:C-type lectin domain-containing protein n=1 Tax=Halocaridina rubra TaxID=373956 RepID=A0AAN8WQE8_HALRR
MLQDCSELANPLESVGYYRVSPSGRSDYGVEVECENFTLDGGWTLTSRAFVLHQNNYAADYFMYGFGDLMQQNDHYFIAIYPSGYEEFQGLCYKLFCDSSYDFRKYLSKCNDEGSALFYPQSIEELEFVRTLLPNYGTAQGPTTQLAIGLNDVNGSWTGGGLYAPDSNITGMANTSDDSENWRIVNFTSTTMTPSRISSNADCTVCQYLARSGCWEPPPSPMENMTRLDNNFTMDFDSEVAYE